MYSRNITSDAKFKSDNYITVLMLQYVLPF